jgi:hypothetical protein
MWHPPLMPGGLIHAVALEWATTRLEHFDEVVGLMLPAVRFARFAFG